jgi:hypothetical protein
LGSYGTGLAIDRTTRAMVQSVYHGGNLSLTATGALHNIMRNEYGIDGRGVYTNQPAAIAGCPGVASYNPSLCSNTRVGDTRTYVDAAVAPGTDNSGLHTVACAVRTTGEVDCWGSTVSGFMRAVGIEPRVREPGAPVTFSF